MIDQEQFKRQNTLIALLQLLFQLLRQHPARHFHALHFKGPADSRGSAAGIKQSLTLQLLLGGHRFDNRLQRDQSRSYAVLGRKRQPHESFDSIAGNTNAVGIHIAKSRLRRDMSNFGC